jgi:hypothetical protein
MSVNVTTVTVIYLLFVAIKVLEYNNKNRTQQQASGTDGSVTTTM